MRSRLLAVLFIAACSTSAPPATTSPQPPVAPAPAVPPVQPPSPVSAATAPSTAPPPMTLAQSGIVGAWLDPKADPCNDFYQFACGGFVASAEIPADRSSWSTIQIVTKDAEEFLRSVLEDAATASRSSGSADPIATKLGTYYAACMDEPAIEAAGTRPIQPLLDRIAKVTDARSAAEAVIALHANGVFPLFSIGAQQDFADATQVIASLDQAGIGLPDRKYYLEAKGTIPKTRAAYLAHVQRMFTLLGGVDANASAADVMRIETALARAQQSEVTRRDPHKVYHRIDRRGLEAKVAPSFPWGDYLAKLDIPAVTAISVHDPRYYTMITKLLQTEPAPALRNYFTWTLLRTAAHTLSKPWVDEAFTLKKELSGVKQLPPRWRRCVQRVDDDLGELLGQSYVAKRFAGDSKARAIDLTKAVIDAMRVQLDALAWMDDATRAAAKAKLDNMAYLVGFPDRWRSYDFEVKRDDFAGNVGAATRWELRRQLGKIGKPVDRFDWQMTPPTVNAYYDPTLNEIALPAGQLQPPFFGATFHPAVNFGSTGGGTIGHEMTHGFDDEGSQFDAEGNLRDWWTRTTKKNFATATRCVVDQYAKYEAVPKVKLDGKLTAGENIADNGGVKIAYQAYQAWKQTQPHVQHKVDGYTDDQLYFIAYAQSWCTKMTPQALETMAHTNPHSPPRWRVNGVIVNQPGFGPAFSCAKRTPMNPGKQCSVW
ncbi:MAG: M13 family metallopeptidase [Kofleriaceae bacterium]